MYLVALLCSAAGVSVVAVWMFVELGNWVYAVGAKVSQPERLWVPCGPRTLPGETRAVV